MKQSKPLFLQHPKSSLLEPWLFKKAECCPRGDTVLPPCVLKVPGLLDLKAWGRPICSVKGSNGVLDALSLENVSQNLLQVFTTSIHALQNENLQGLGFLKCSKRMTGVHFLEIHFSPVEKFLISTYQNHVKTHFRLKTNCKVFKINFFKRVKWMAFRNEWKRKEDFRPGPGTDIQNRWECPSRCPPGEEVWDQWQSCACPAGQWWGKEQTEQAPCCERRKGLQNPDIIQRGWQRCFICPPVLLRMHLKGWIWEHQCSMK